MVRTLPKASRAAYPCQRIALSVGLSFLAYLSGVIASVTIFKNLKKWINTFSKPLGTTLLAIFVLFIGTITALTVESYLTDQKPVYADWNPSDNPNTPIGEAKGKFPGRVTWAYNPLATEETVIGNWWQKGNTNQLVVDSMIKDSLLALTGTKTTDEAWASIFHFFNQSHNRGDIGYTPGEKIAIKINTVNTYNQRKNNNYIDIDGESLLALVTTLVGFGVEERDITIYDGGVGSIGDYVVNPVHDVYPDIIFQSITPWGPVKAVQWVNEGIVYSDGVVVTNADTRRVAKVVWDADYLINFALLKKHEHETAVTLTGKNHYGSIKNCRDVHYGINDYINGMGTYNNLVDLAGHEKIGAKTMLYIIDGLWASPGVLDAPVKWSSFGNDWPSSIFMSQDFVAIDSVGLDFLNAEFELWDNGDNYLHEAALADNPPSGTIYDPEDDGTPLKSLGVHEHWNNSTDKEYSRNLGTGEGIELVKVVNSIENKGEMGDVNIDGNINVVDSLIIAQHYVAIPVENFHSEYADVNEDLAINIIDSLLIAQLYVGIIESFKE
ncbi:MAG: DUF362 domain-containing protein [Spirochaetales bacterium]|nr:DUF362 domain-containing protein [Spirochaetales bacterium]